MAAAPLPKGYYRRTVAGVAMVRMDLDVGDAVTGTSTQYLHKDLQGSLDVITDSNGQVAENGSGNKLVYSFDVWGKRRNPFSWAQIAGGPDSIVASLQVGVFNHLISNRGYTGHEMLDEVGLIHMNGRVYDPTLVRFVSADPTIDGVTGVQGCNRYAYVQNNPLLYSGQTGYSSRNEFRDKCLKRIAAIAITIYTGGAVTEVILVDTIKDAFPRQRLAMTSVVIPSMLSELLMGQRCENAV